MYILDLTLNKIIIDIKEGLNKNNYYLITCTPNELETLKDILDIDEDTFEECLEFDDNMKLDIFEKYDFISLNTYQVINRKIKLTEVNMYLSNKFILLITDEKHFLYTFLLDTIQNKKHYGKKPTINLFNINYLIFKKIILNAFHNIELVEDSILELEDSMMNSISDINMSDINQIRELTRTIVKNTRPLLHIGNRIMNRSMRYLNCSDIKKHNLENLQGIDFGFDKLYGFAMSTRELADKLLDIYSSQVTEKTNSLITKLTVLTAITSPLTIITGIYGMNFKNMPELNFYYGYYLILIIMVTIIFISLFIMKIKKLL